MAQDLADINSLAIEVSRGDEPELVAADIEDVEAVPPYWHKIDAPKGLFKFDQIREGAEVDRLEPISQWGFGIAMNLPEIRQCLPRDQVHGDTLTQIATGINST